MASALVLTGTEALGVWTVNKERKGAGTDVQCVLQSEKRPMSDGYLDINVWIEVTDRTVLVRTQSPLDTSFSDIGIRVDKNGFIPLNEVWQRTSALFESEDDELIKQFKRGREVTAQLRFWPTWPETGTHSVIFSLNGFTKAYNKMQACSE
jgi:hypothetical protein